MTPRRFAMNRPRTGAYGFVWWGALMVAGLGIAAVFIGLVWDSEATVQGRWVGAGEPATESQAETRLAFWIAGGLLFGAGVAGHLALRRRDRRDGHAIELDNDGIHLLAGTNRSSVRWRDVSAYRWREPELSAGAVRGHGLAGRAGASLAALLAARAEDFWILALDVDGHGEPLEIDGRLVQDPVAARRALTHALVGARDDS